MIIICMCTDLSYACWFLLIDVRHIDYCYWFVCLMHADSLLIHLMHIDDFSNNASFLCAVQDGLILGFLGRDYCAHQMKLLFWSDLHFQLPFAVLFCLSVYACWKNDCQQNNGWMRNLFNILVDWVWGNRFELLFHALKFNAMNSNLIKILSLDLFLAALINLRTHDIPLISRGLENVSDFIFKWNGHIIMIAIFHTLSFLKKSREPNY